MKTEYTCPLGHTCEKVVGNHIEICAWYTKVQGTNPQTGERVDETKCAISLIPLLQIEQTGKTMQVAQGVSNLTDSVDKTRKAQLVEIKTRLENNEIIANQ